MSDEPNAFDKIKDVLGFILFLGIVGTFLTICVGLVYFAVTAPETEEYVKCKQDGEVVYNKKIEDYSYYESGALGGGPAPLKVKDTNGNETILRYDECTIKEKKVHK